MAEILLTEAARRIGVSRLTIWRAIKRGEIKKVKRIARYTFLDSNEVERWAEKWRQKVKRKTK